MIQGRSKMLIPTIIMAVISVILLFIALQKDGNNVSRGFNIAFKLTLEVLPLLFFAFIIAGFIQVLIPSDLINKWVGTESGAKGIFLGTIAGALTPGGPYVSLPIVAALAKSGAGIGTLVAFLTSWSLWAIARLPMEVGILGVKFTLVRILSVFIFPPIAGYIANFLSRIFK